MNPVGSQPPQSMEHDLRARFLDALALLLGYADDLLGGQLPDGRRPDVLRLDPRRRALFIGDAKDSETPGCRETQVRLARYLEWVAAHVDMGGTAIFTLCFGDQAIAYSWIETLDGLAYDASLQALHTGVESFSYGFIVAWYVFGADRTITPPRPSPFNHQEPIR